MNYVKPIFHALCLALLMSVSTVSAGEGTITGVQVAPGSDAVKISFQGKIGKPTARVLGGPYRLVLDFASSDLAKIGAKIPVQREPIKQVRLGHENDRTRVVVDFGENPVPPFRLKHASDHVAITFGSRLCQGRNEFDKPAASSVKPRSHVRAAGPAPTPTAKQLPVSLKRAELRNNVVMVELGDVKLPKHTYRLILNIDPVASKIKRATLDDTSTNPVHVAAGPKKMQSGVQATHGSGDSPKFKWGLSRTGGGPVKGAQSETNTPKVEPYTLLPRDDARQKVDGPSGWDRLTVEEKKPRMHVGGLANEQD